MLPVVGAGKKKAVDHQPSVAVEEAGNPGPTVLAARPALAVVVAGAAVVAVVVVGDPDAAVLDA